MKHMNCWAAAVMVGTLPLMGCSKHAAAHPAEHASTIEAIPGSPLKKVILTEKAVSRLNVATEQVREEGGQKVVPYSSLIYDFQGKTWVYTSPTPRTFVRSAIDVDRIVGDRVLLKAGPPTGTVIAALAVAELYGTEFAVGH